MENKIKETKEKIEVLIDKLINSNVFKKESKALLIGLIIENNQQNIEKEGFSDHQNDIIYKLRFDFKTSTQENNSLSLTEISLPLDHRHYLVSNNDLKPYGMFDFSPILKE